MPDIKDGALKPMHKRGDRVILQHAGARRHLKYLSKKYLKKLKQNEILQPELEREMTREMLDIAYRITSQAFYESLLIFTEKAMHQDMLHVLARYTLGQVYILGQPSEKDLQELKTYCVELAQLIILVSHTNASSLSRISANVWWMKSKECMRKIGLLQQSILCWYSILFHTIWCAVVPTTKI